MAAKKNSKKRDDNPNLFKNRNTKINKPGERFEDRPEVVNVPTELFGERNNRKSL